MLFVGNYVVFKELPDVPVDEGFHSIYCVFVVSVILAVCFGSGGDHKNIRVVEMCQSL